MLMLTRRPGERLMIGNNVVVQIMEIKGNQVRVGVEAPKDIDVDREEIFMKKQNDRNKSTGNRR
jgi:carbon storage regulator